METIIWDRKTLAKKDKELQKNKQNMKLFGTVHQFDKNLHGATIVLRLYEGGYMTTQTLHDLHPEGKTNEEFICISRPFKGTVEQWYAQMKMENSSTVVVGLTSK